MRPTDTTFSPPAYVVSSRKLAILFWVSGGLYSWAWFYQHFRAQNTHKDAPLLDGAKAFFSIFCSYFLFSRLNKAAEQENTRKAWHPAVSWVLVSGVAIVSFCQALVLYPLTPLLVPVWLGIQFIALRNVQMAANLSAGDPEGDDNATVTRDNWAMTIPCGLYVLIGNLYMLSFYAQYLLTHR